MKIIASTIFIYMLCITNFRYVECEEFSSAYLMSIGRLGNIMFEYAALLGICIKRKAINIQSCAKLCASSGNSLFLEIFPSLKYSTEKSCRPSLKFTEKNLNFDSRIFLQPNNIRYEGFFQSYKYFDLHGSDYVKSAFKFTDYTNKEAIKILSAIKNHSNYMKSHPLVCLHARRGDKVKSHASDYNFYDGWSLSDTYYYHARNHFKDLYGRINLVIFTGGGFNAHDKVQDLTWSREHLKRKLAWGKEVKVFNIEEFDNVTNSDMYDNPALSMKLLSLCDNLIISSSSFSWWAAYLSNHTNIVAPKHLYVDSVEFIPEDYYLPTWTLLEDPEKYHPKNYIKLTPSNVSPMVTTLSIRGSDETTVVTCYFSIPSNIKESINVDWSTNFMNMNFKNVIFVDNDSYNILSSLWPETERRKYIIRPILFNLNSTTYESVDAEKKMGHNHMCNSNKIFSLRDIVISNPFKTEYFAWVDISCFRNKELLHNFNGFPDISKINKNKVNFIQIIPFTEVEKRNVMLEVDDRFLFVNRIDSGHFVGNKEAILLLSDVYQDILDEFKTKSTLIGKDQSIFAFASLRHPYLIETFKAESSNYDRKFIAQYLWSKFGKTINNSYIPSIQSKKKQNIPSVSNTQSSIEPCLCRICLLLLSRKLL